MNKELFVKCTYKCCGKNIFIVKCKSFLFKIKKIILTVPHIYRKYIYIVISILAKILYFFYSSIIKKDKQCKKILIVNQ